MKYKIIIDYKFSNFFHINEFTTLLQLEEYIAHLKKEGFYSYFKKNYNITIKKMIYKF